MRFFEVHRFNGFVSNVATAIDISFFKFWDDLSHDKNFEAILAKQRTILHFGDPNPNRNGPRETQDSRKSWNWVCENIQESCKDPKRILDLWIPYIKHSVTIPINVKQISREKQQV